MAAEVNTDAWLPRTLIVALFAGFFCNALPREMVLGNVIRSSST